MEIPEDFRCPISMELMKDPVTIPTGVTYDRKSIEKWLRTYNKKTCPATMQPIETLETTPNHTLKRLIDSWLHSQSTIHHHDLKTPSSSSSSAANDELADILASLVTTPFKASCLKKLRLVVVDNEAIVMRDFVNMGGVDILVNIIIQTNPVIVDDNNKNYDFAPLRACEEALAVLHLVPFNNYLERLMMRPDCMGSMAVVLRRGSSEARFYAISIFLKMSKADYQWDCVARDQGFDFFKSLLETVSDEVCTKTSSCALQLLVQILEASKKSRLKAIEAGAMWSVIELLAETSRRAGARCERMLQVIKLMCECAEGRMAFAEHGMGMAAVAEKMTGNVSDGATRVVVKLLWLVSSFHGTERVLEEMMLCGAVEKMVQLLYGGGRGSVKDRVVKMLRLHGGKWRRYPCFPKELKSLLGNLL